jgi:serine protease Do
MNVFNRCTGQRWALVSVTFLLTSGVLSAQAAPAARAAPAQPSRSELKLEIDRKPINRNAPDQISYAPIVEHTAESVVYVYSSRQVRAPQLPPIFNDPMFRRFFDLPEGGPDGRMPDRTQQGLGSGVVITRDGYILTNNHVIDGADDVKVAFGDARRRYDAVVVGGDALADIAVLKIEAEGLVPASFGDSDLLQVGDRVLAIGNPFGIGRSVTSGIVSALSRGGLGIEAIEDFIQTDAAINRGNSGGALIDVQGRVIGINTAIVSGTGGFAGVGFAIPSNLAINVASQIVNTGRVSRGFLGVAPQNLSPELADQFGTHQGALIAEVTPDSPAERAGLQAGDIITRINDIEINDPRQLLLTISQFAPDTEVQVQYLRDRQPHTTTARLMRRPDSPDDAEADGERDSGVLQGIALNDLTPQFRRQLQIPARVQGAVITRVDPESAAARQGLRVGDVILEMNRQPVRNAADATRLSDEIVGPRVVLLLWRDGRSLFVVIDESRQ